MVLSMGLLGLVLLLESPGILSTFVWFFPVFITAQAVFFPSMNKRRARRLFPAFQIGGFGIGLDELLLMAALLGFGILFIGWFLNRKTVKVHFPHALLTSVVFGVLFGFGVVRGLIESNSAVMTEARTILLPTLYFIMVLCALDLKDIPTFRKVVIVALVILSLSSFLEKLSPAYRSFSRHLPFPEARISPGGEGRTGGVEVFSILKLLYALALASYLNGESPQKGFLLMTVIALMGQLIPFDKTTFVQLPLITFLLMLVLGSRRWLRWRGIVLWRAVGIFIVIVLLLIVGVTLLLPDQFVERYREFVIFRVTRPDTGDPTSGRFYLWSQAIDLILQKPLLGHGVGVMYETPRYGDFVREHNMLLWIGVRLGIPAMLLVTGLFVWYVRYGVMVIRSLCRKNKSFAAAMFAFSVTLCIMSLVGVQLLYPEIGFLFAFSCGALLKMHRLRFCNYEG
jgi:O-antigen ligase